MGVLIYNSIRIYRQNKEAFSAQECESIKAFLFDSPYYHSQGFQFRSRFTPIIFERANNSLCIEVQFNRYNDYMVWRNLEWLYEMTFPAYEFWFIINYDSSSPNQDTDVIGHFKYLAPDESAYPNNEPNFRICRYHYDQIKLSMIPGSDALPEELSGIPWQKTVAGYESINHSGTYTSNNSKSVAIREDQSYKLEVETGSIALKDKYDLRKGGALYLYVNHESYDYPELDHFIRHQRTSSNILKMDFYYKGRHVRRLRKNRPKEALCMDGWDNCADEGFMNYLSKR